MYSQLVHKRSIAWVLWCQLSAKEKEGNLSEPTLIGTAVQQSSKYERNLNFKLKTLLAWSIDV
jgi:hypothetical protein